MEKLRIIVGGLVGQYPLGGVAWDYFHYVLALHELGHDVYYHEDTWVWPFDPARQYPVDAVTGTLGSLDGELLVGTFVRLDRCCRSGCRTRAEEAGDTRCTGSTKH